MGNQLHLVVRLRPDVVAAWSPIDVSRHALAVLPIRSGPALEPLTVTPTVIDRNAGDARWLAEQRARLSSPGWLQRLVKQEVSRRANAEDGCQWRSLNPSPSIGVFPLARFAAIRPSFRGISDEFCDVDAKGLPHFIRNRRP